MLIRIVRGLSDQEAVGRMQLCPIGSGRLPGELTNKVCAHYNALKDLEKCSPAGRDCIEKNSAETFNCSISCEGIYADIHWQRNEEMTYEIDKEKYAMLSSEYQNFKRKNVEIFRFISSAPMGMFGEQICQ